MQPAGYILINREGHFVDYRCGANLNLTLYDRWSIETEYKGYKICGVSPRVLGQIATYYADIRKGERSPRLDIRHMPRVADDRGNIVICTPHEAEFEAIHHHMMAGISTTPSQPKPGFVRKIFSAPSVTP